MQFSEYLKKTKMYGNIQIEFGNVFCLEENGNLSKNILQKIGAQQVDFDQKKYAHQEDENCCNQRGR